MAWLNMNIMLSFFFSSRRRHTRCLSDWSSDVCSSDLCIFAPCGTKMQLGSAALHWATAGRHLPFAQKKFAGQVTFWHWLATACDGGMLQLPSLKQTLPPPPQSESRSHLVTIALQFPPGQVRPWPSPHPARSAAAMSPRSPLAIPHPPPAKRAGAERGGDERAGRQPPERRLRRSRGNTDETGGFGAPLPAVRSSTLPDMSRSAILPRAAAALALLCSTAAGAQQRRPVPLREALQLAA